MELLLYLSGYRQISKAIDLIGVKETTKEVIGIIICATPLKDINALDQLVSSLNISLDNNLLARFSSKRDFIKKFLISEGFNVSEYTNDEIELVLLQRVALLALQK